MGDAAGGDMVWGTGSLAKISVTSAAGVVTGEESVLMPTNTLTQAVFQTPLSGPQTEEEEEGGELNTMLQIQKPSHRVSFRWGTGLTMSCSDGAQGPLRTGYWQTPSSA